MSILVKGMSKKDFEEILKYARYGANNCMIGERAEVVELPPHGRLKDADALTEAMESTDWYHQAESKDMVHGANSAEHQAWYKEQDVYAKIDAAPTIIEAEPEVHDCDNCKWFGGLMCDHVDENYKCLGWEAEGGND